MLDPGDRCLLLQSLRPPEGYRLDAAVGTTFTLDLMALLTAPLAFTFFEYEEQDGRPSANPLALFEAARRAAKRMHIFCHGGGIKVPPANRQLLPLVEDCVIQVLPKGEGGVFHPKVWLLRYESEEGDACYRFLCLSRNLTFDRSWDTVLVLDGELHTEYDRRERNEPLARFLRALPSWAIGELPPNTQRDIDRMADELDHVEFFVPDGFVQRRLRFHPLGLGDPEEEWPFPYAGKGALAISPFLTASFLADLAEGRPGSVLISRPEALDELTPEALEPFESVYVLDEDAEPEQTAEDGAEEVEEAPYPRDQQGLHAKLFVVEGWPTRIFTGSANATSAAFGGSIEFLVELAIPGTRSGIESVLGPEDKPQEGLQSVLKPWDKTPRGLDPKVALQRRLEEEIDTAARRLLRSGLTLKVEALPEDTYALVLTGGEGAIEIPADIKLEVWPISLGSGRAQPLEAAKSELLRFSPISFSALTAFLGFRGTITRKGITCESEFVLRFPLIDAPENRRQRLLRDLIEDRDHLLQLIALLLAREGVSVRDLAEAAGAERNASDGSSSHGSYGFPLLEGLLDAIDAEPERLDDVADLVKDLVATEHGRELVPPELMSLIEEFVAVREALRA